MSDQDHNNFVNKVVSVPALLGNPQNFPLADTLFPRVAISGFCKLTQCAFVNRSQELNPFVSLFGDLTHCVDKRAVSLTTHTS